MEQTYVQEQQGWTNSNGTEGQTLAETAIAAQGCVDLFYAKVPELGFWTTLGQFLPYWASPQAQRLGAA